MARPIKAAEAKRDFTIEVRVSFAEKDEIKAIAKQKGLNMSDFLRGLAIGAKPLRHIPSDDRELLLRLLAESNKIGSNINQIARQLNRKMGDDVVDSYTIKSIDYSLGELNKLNSELIGLLR